MLKNERGITPVVSNLLLLVVAVAAMSVATTATYVITGSLRDTMGERFVVEDVWFKQNGEKEVAIYLRNIGKLTIEMSAVYLNNTSPAFIPFDLEIEDHGWLNLTYSWGSGSVYRIMVMTNRGAKVVDYYRAP